jgi:aryl-alcohol dehydrogenase-like predicted oxidoreductase
LGTLKKRKLGNTGIEMQELTLGTWGLCAESYGQVFPEQVTATLARAVEQGIYAFDMAPTWGEHGASERAVAQAVGGRRDDVQYITRVGQLSSEYGPAAAFSPEALREQCEASLRRLATDHVDVLLLQHPTFDDLRKDELRATMEALCSEGKTRTWGASVSNSDEGRAAIVSGARVLCVPFSLVTPEIVWDLTSECRERGVGLLARSVLMYGLLSGRWGEKKRFTPDDHRMYRWSAEAIAARVRKASELQSKIQPSAPSMATLALHFVLAHEDIASAIVGPRTPAQVSATLEALGSELPLSVVDMQYIYNSVR